MVRIGTWNLEVTTLGAVASARAAAREVVWAQRAERTGRAFPPAKAAGRELPGLVIDLDASTVVCHSEKEHAAPRFKRTFGYHLMLALILPVEVFEQLAEHGRAAFTQRSPDRCANLHWAPT